MPSGVSRSVPRYGGVVSPAKSMGYNPSSQFGNQGGLNAPTGYDAPIVSTTVDELTAGFRGMVVGEDYGSLQQGSSFRVSAAVSQPQTLLSQPNAQQVRMPHLVQPHQTRPSFGGYTPQADYTAYYAGPSAIDYSYTYDAYHTNPDTTIYGTPAQTSSTPPGANMYAGLSSQTMHPHSHVHADLPRHPTGVFYDYSGSTRPPGSQYYYTTPQPMVYHPSTGQHSPMQTTAIGHIPPASLTDKKRELQVCASHCPHLRLYRYMCVTFSSTLFSSINNSTIRSMVCHDIIRHRHMDRLMVPTLTMLTEFL